MISAEGFSAPKDPLVGQVIQERYRIVHAIGRGAMGIVYEAQHLLIGRKVALKTMAAHAVSPAGVQRFRREAQAAAAVGNSHVVDVLDMGRLENGSLYIVMEHLDGVDLGFAVALEQRFSVGRAIHVLGQLCDALSAIHEAGIIHRDLKPENIFLTTHDGVPDFVKVLDFGVCRFNDAGDGRLTATGDTVGTPLFMAPEQVEGRADCDQRADIYALGAILYFVLTGRAPFDAPNLPALFLRICHEPAPSLRSTDSSLSCGLDAIVQRALSKDPAARFSSCSAFKSALRSLQASPDEIAATLPGAVEHTRRGDYVWGVVSGKGTATVTLAQSLRLWRPRWVDLGAIGLGVLAAAFSSGAYLVRTHAEASSSNQANVRALPRVVEPSPKALQPPDQIIPGAELEAWPVESRLRVQPQSVANSLLASSDRVSPKPKQNRPPSTATRPPQDVALDSLPVASPPLPSASAESQASPPSQSQREAVTPAPRSSADPSALDLHFTRGLKHDL